MRDRPARTSAPLLAALLLLGPAAAAAAATLRTESVVAGAYVTLGDLFDGLTPEQAATPVAQAPELGRDVLLDVRWLSQVAGMYNVDWQPVSSEQRLPLRRASQTLSRAAIQDAVQREAAARMPDSRVEVQLDGQVIEMVLPVDVDPTIGVVAFDLVPASGRFTATVVSPAEGTPAARLTLTGRLTSLVEVPVLATRAERGEIVGAEDIVWIDLPSDRVPSGALTDAVRLVGMAARRGIAERTPIRADDLEAPVLVVRGSNVVMTLNQGALSLTTKGRALEDGALGEVVRVVNTDSNRTIDATVVGDAAVAVSPGAPAP